MAALDMLPPENFSAPSGSDLVREANHRIANHLTMIVGMVQIQASALAKGPEILTRTAVHDILLETAGKIFSVSHLHRNLADSPQAKEIDIAAYLVDSCSAMSVSLSLSRRVGIVYRLGQKCLVSTERAQTIALIVNEIVMNAIKHAHPTDLPTNISIGCGRDANGRMYIEVADDGVGLPEDFDEKRGGGVGFKLIRALTKQIGATLRMESSSLGLCFRLTFAE